MATEQKDTLIGRRFGSYEIRKRIGAGGMGMVYQAHDRALDRPVAVKILSPSLAEDAEFEKRFIREARLAAKLDHPNIVPVYAAARAEGHLFMAMQFVDGETLDKIMDAKGPLPAKIALDIVAQVADALQAAHELGLIHRDIKPTNVMIEASGRVKLMDFGLARSFHGNTKFTQTDIYLGTPEYSSPEQCETGELDSRTDLYSLGVVAYELLAGRPPHVAETPLALFRKIADEDSPPLRSANPAVPEDVAGLVHRMLERDRTKRIQSAGEIAAECRRILARFETGAAPAARPPWKTVAGVCAAAALLAAVAIFAWPDAGDPTPPPQDPPVTPVSDNRPVVSEPVGMVVLDFTSGTGAPEHAWMEIGLADLLSRTLQQNPSLRVPTRSDLVGAVGAPRVTADALTAIAETHPHRFHISGQYYVSGDEVRLFVDLNGDGGTTSRQFDGKVDDFFAMIDGVSAWVGERVAERVNVNLVAVFVGEAPPAAPQNCEQVAMGIIPSGEMFQIGDTGAGDETRPAEEPSQQGQQSDRRGLRERLARLRMRGRAESNEFERAMEWYAPQARMAQEVDPQTVDAIFEQLRRSDEGYQIVQMLNQAGGGYGTEVQGWIQYACPSGDCGPGQSEPGVCPCGQSLEAHLNVMNVDRWLERVVPADEGEGETEEE